MTELLIPKKNIILDATVLTSLMTCARKSDFQFNMHLQSVKGKSNSLECGSIVHSFLENYYKSIIGGMDKTKAVGFGMTAAELYIRGCEFCTDFLPSDETPKPVCGHKVNDYPGVKNTPIESEGNKIGWKWVLTTCEQYYDFYKNDYWVPLEVETVKQKILYEDESMRILWKSKLDLTADTNQGIFPIDHKTMKQNRDTSNLNNQFIGQCLMMNTRNVIINKIGFQKSLEPKDKFIRGVVSYSSSRMIEWTNEILPYYANELLKYNEMEYFPPNWSNCDGKYGPCPFHDVCKSDVEMREEELRNQFVVGKEWNPTNEDE